MEEYPYSERRRSVRVAINVSMHLVVFNAGASISLQPKELIKLRKGVVRNLSLTGVSIVTNDLLDDWFSPLLSGIIQMALKFQLPDSPEPINASAKVVWIKKIEKPSEYRYSLGLKFIDIGDADSVKLIQYIVKCQSKEKEGKS